MKKFSYHPRLYLSDDIDQKRLGQIKRRLRHSPLLADVYLIVPAQNQADQLEFWDARQLAQGYYKEKCFLVLGIADDWSGAVLLVEKMVQDCLKERGNCKLREYFYDS